MPDPKTYTGGCHCGRVRYEVTCDLAMVMACNCSICAKRGALWTFAKKPQFKLLQGADALSDYQFGQKRIHHLFCQSCGVGSFSQGVAPNGDETVAINVRCLDDVDVSALPVKPFDGKSLEEHIMARVAMIPPETTEPETREVYDGVLKQWGRISNFSQVLAHQPAALAGWMLPNEAIRLRNVKADPDYVKIQQLVIIKTSALNRSAYCMSHNVPLGKKVGLSEAQIAAAQGDDYMTSPDLDDRQKSAIRWADAVTKMTARDDDDAFAAMKKHFTERQIVELTVFCGMWNYSNRLCEALHVDLERPDKRIEFQK